MLIGKWLQPSGFTHDVHNRLGIILGEGVILQCFGVIACVGYSSHGNALAPDEAHIQMPCGTGVVKNRQVQKSRLASWQQETGEFCAR